MAKVEIPDGFTVRGFKFEIEQPEECSIPVFNSHFGARRYAFNWAISTVEKNIKLREAAKELGIPETVMVPSLSWSFRNLRNLWNVEKDFVAPWWDVNSKESYASGIKDAAVALDNWWKSKTGKRKGRRVGFPKLKSKRRDRARVRFTTGAMRLENARDIILPVIGKVVSKENTRRLRRLLKNAGSKIYSMTLSRSSSGRFYVSVSALIPKLSVVEVEFQDVSVGADAGIGKDNWIVLIDTEGVVRERITAPTHWSEYEADIRKLSRQMSRRISGSRGWNDANNARNKLYEKQRNVRDNALHQLTSKWVKTYGRIVLEGLDWSALGRALFRKDRRAVSQTGLGRLKPMLAYKSESTTCEIIIADKWFPSSKMCSNLSCGKINRWLKRQKSWTCEECNTHQENRDDVAGANLARYDELEWQKLKKQLKREQAQDRKRAAKTAA